MVKAKISFVSPCFNEEKNIVNLCNRIIKVAKKINVLYEIILVDNGSIDETKKIIINLNKKNKNIRSLVLSRNFGYQNAIFSGLKFAKGDYVCVLDGDLQDPPEVVEKMYKMILKDYDVIYGVHKKREGAGFKNIFYRLFYILYSKLSEMNIPKDSGEFAIFNKRVLKEILLFNENLLFIRGIRSWVGFKQAGYNYTRSKREAGKAKFNLWGSFQFALDGLISFSIRPLRAILMISIIIMFPSLIALIMLLMIKILSFTEFNIFNQFVMPKGLTFTNIMILFLLTINMIFFGLISEYIARIYIEIKKRPKYIIEKII